MLIIHKIHAVDTLQRDTLTFILDSMVKSGYIKSFKRYWLFIAFECFDDKTHLNTLKKCYQIYHKTELKILKPEELAYELDIILSELSLSSDDYDEENNVF